MNGRTGVTTAIGGESLGKPYVPVQDVRPYIVAQYINIQARVRPSWGQLIAFHSPPIPHPNLAPTGLSFRARNIKLAGPRGRGLYPVPPVVGSYLRGE